MTLIDGDLVLPILVLFFFAGILKGILGFGLPIMTMASLPFFVSVEQAIVLSAIVQPFTNLFQLVTSGAVRKAFSLALPILVALVPGVVIGAWYLTSLDSDTLLLIIGATIIAFAVSNLAGFRITIPKGREVHAGLAFGMVAGIFGALTSLNGWAFIMYLVGIGLPRREFRSAIALMFLVSGFLISSSFWVVGLLDMRLAIGGALALCSAFPGMWIGDILGQKIPGELFTKVLLVTLMIIGSVLVWRAAF